MAEKKEESKDVKSEAGDKATPEGGKTGLVTWIVMFAVVAVLSGSGYVLGRLMPAGAPADAAAAEVDKAEDATAAEAKPAPAAADEKASSLSANQETWYYNDLESVVVNPDEPGATRYIRVGLILEIGNEYDPIQTKAILDAKKPLLINWLNLYFKGLTLGAIENEKGLKRVLTQICEGFNEILAPSSKPLVKHILIREFNIQ